MRVLLLVSCLSLLAACSSSHGLPDEVLPACVPADGELEVRGGWGFGGGPNTAPSDIDWWTSHVAGGDLFAWPTLFEPAPSGGLESWATTLIHPAISDGGDDVTYASWVSPSGGMLLRTAAVRDESYAIALFALHGEEAAPYALSIERFGQVAASGGAREWANESIAIVTDDRVLPSAVGVDSLFTEDGSFVAILETPTHPATGFYVVEVTAAGEHSVTVIDAAMVGAAVTDIDLFDLAEDANGVLHVLAAGRGASATQSSILDLQRADGVWSSSLVAIEEGELERAALRQGIVTEATGTPTFLWLAKQCTSTPCASTVRVSRAGTTRSVPLNVDTLFATRPMAFERAGELPSRAIRARVVRQPSAPDFVGHVHEITLPAEGDGVAELGDIRLPESLRAPGTIELFQRVELTFRRDGTTEWTSASFSDASRTTMLVGSYACPSGGCMCEIPF